MKSVPQHACDECNEFIAAIAQMKQKLHEAKRLPTLGEMQIELCALETEMGALRTKAYDMKAFVTRAVMQVSVREYQDEIAPRHVGMWPERCAGTTTSDNGVPMMTENGRANSDE